jgi:hypothetical protein
VLDLDVFVLRDLAPWRTRCAASAVLGRDGFGTLNAGVRAPRPAHPDAASDSGAAPRRAGAKG